MFGEDAGLLFEISGATGGGGGGEELGVFFGFGEAVGFAARAFLFVFFGGGDGSCAFVVRLIFGERCCCDDFVFGLLQVTHPPKSVQRPRSVQSSSRISTPPKIAVVAACWPALWPWKCSRMKRISDV